MRKSKYIIITTLITVLLFLTACTNCERRLYGCMFGSDNFRVKFAGYDNCETDISRVQKINKGELIKKPEDPVTEGYKVVGWYVVDENGENKHFWDFDKDVPIKALTLYAEWEPITIKVTFNTNGGKETYDDILLTYNTTYYFYNYIPTRENYTFVGWYDESGNRINSGTSKYTKDITLTAKWESNT